MKLVHSGLRPFAVIPAFLLVTLGFTGSARADQLVYQLTGADLALAKFGLTGKGVVVAILDRGIQWQNPDFINPDGTTRIKYMLDMDGQQDCSASNPAPIEYTAAQINAALAGTGPTIPERDAVGHGTASIGMTTGNGRAFAAGKYTGIAPQADLVIIRSVSEAEPAHGTEPAQAAFQACYTQAFQWLDQKLTAIGEPAVAFINSENTFGAHDGTSSISSLVDQYFSNRPGRAFVFPSGDEGLLADHAGGTFTGTQNTVVSFTRTAGDQSPIAIWYSGSAKANITVNFSDGTSAGPLGPVSLPINDIASSPDNSVSLYQFFPGSEFYPETSTSGDHFAYVLMNGHATTGTITIRGVTGSDTGTFDMYSDLNGTTIFTSNIVPGHINDWATTRSASVTGAYVIRTSWVDIDGITRTDNTEGAIGALWTGSNDGPTRDGRLGISVVSPGHNTWTSYATNSFWATNRSVLVQDGGGFYGRGGAVSGATPIITGAVALMLQLNPALTSQQANAFLQNSATTDGFTGAVPNYQWGYGKLNILGALNLVSQCSSYTLNAGGQSFTSQGGTGTITVTAPAGCPWSVTGLPAGITLTGPDSGTGNGTVSFVVNPNSAGDVSNTFTVAGNTFTIQQEAASIPGLSFIGSMAHLAAEENWTTTFTLVNKGAVPATARLSFSGDATDPTGIGPLTLPVVSPQQPDASGPILGASFDQTLGSNASLIATTGGPQTPPVLVGSAQLSATGAVDGFAIFHQIPTAQEAVVPMETRNASSYLLAFDNTNNLVLGVAVENVSAQNAVIGVVIRDDTGALISAPGASISLGGNGHTAFVLSDPTLGFPVTANKRGTIEFDTPAGGRISVLGLRFTPPNNALTTIPALANVGTGGGSIAHLASGGDGWQTTFVLVNTGTTSAPATLSFFNDLTGAPLSLPMTFPQGGMADTTAPTLAKTLAPGATLIIVSSGAPNLLTGSAQLSTTGHVSGFVIFRHNGQEAIVPLESRNANAYIVAFDNTNGTATGVAVNTVSAQTVNIPVTVRDDTGATIAADTIAMNANGHYAFTLGTDRYPGALTIRGTIEFDTPANAHIGALGIRIPTGEAHTYTTLPALAK